MVLFNTLEMDYCDQGKGWFGCWSQTMCLLALPNENISYSRDIYHWSQPKQNFFSLNQNQNLTRYTSPQQHRPLDEKVKKVHKQTK